MERLTVGKYNLICFTDAGKKLMLTLGEKLNDRNAFDAENVENLSDFTSEVFNEGNVLIYIGAVAIAVRAIAPFVKDKTTDPAVLAIDEQGNFVVPVLSGHIGGANEYARQIAELIGAIPVVTTATDIRGEFAVDVFARKNNLEINDMKMAKEFSAKLLRGEDAVFTVSPRAHSEDGLFLIPKCLVVGMGCRKGKSFEELEEFLLNTLKENYLDVRAIKAMVSIDIKKDEEGLKMLADSLSVPFVTYSADTLMAQEGDFDSSELVLEKTGADNVCERAVSAYGAEKILVHKTAKDGMTIAIGVQT
ncbi:cobalt-precorrin 5A hydrolase [Butyrivibrio sp. AE2032]|uniref:cobalt-precorrin 5A hydrolase n=1 Tax=Butyrivibrio sp. AE2032 TaxID=1458463 RepID=UPI00068E5028|nr:cobalamin biosynthesis protein [Butyrivibrio sp. AE2032]